MSFLVFKKDKYLYFFYLEKCESEMGNHPAANNVLEDPQQQDMITHNLMKQHILDNLVFQTVSL